MKEEIRKAFELVKEITCLDADEMLSSTRKRQPMIARQMIAYYLRKHTDMTLESIGETINKDHSTVVYGIQCIEDMSEADPYSSDIKKCLDNKIVTPIHGIREDLKEAFLRGFTTESRVDHIMTLLFRKIKVFQDQERIMKEKTHYDNALELQKKEIKQLKESMSKIISLI
jgi:hypothetical protein